MWMWFAVIPWPDLTLIFHGICLSVTLEGLSLRRLVRMLKFWYESNKSQDASNKGADRTGLVHRLVCVFVVACIDVRISRVMAQ